MTESDKAVMQMALDALERVDRVDSNCDILTDDLCNSVMDAIESLRAAIAQPVKVDASSILGAVARGWCHPANAKKAMDVDLAIAISAEVNELLAQPEQTIKQNFCPQCGKRIIRIDDVHTCTPHAYKKTN